MTKKETVRVHIISAQQELNAKALARVAKEYIMKGTTNNYELHGRAKVRSIA